MAGKNIAHKRSSLKTRKTKLRRNGKQSTNTTGFGSLVAKGIRTLLSTLPGSTLTVGIADFVFKSLGYTESFQVSEDGAFTAQMKVTALTANFHIALKDVLFDSYTHGTKLNTTTWTSNYQSGRLISLQVKIVPETPYGERRGVLGAAFIPFRTEEENTWYDSNAAGVLIEQLKRIPGAKTGPAGRTITLNFRPKATDGRLHFDMPLKAEIGAVVISFDQTSRDAYSMFTADQFSAMVYISGAVKLQRPQEEPNQIAYARKIDDKLASKVAFIKRPNDPKFYGIYGTAVNSASGVEVKGRVSQEDLSIIRKVDKGMEHDAAEALEAFAMM